MGIAHSEYAEERASAARAMLRRRQNECVHEGTDCETITACSEGCNCGCAGRTEDEIAEGFKERFRNNIREVVERYIRGSEGTRLDGHVVVHDSTAGEFIQELYEAVGVA